MCVRVRRGLEVRVVSISAELVECVRACVRVCVQRKSSEREKIINIRIECHRTRVPLV